MSLLRSLKGGLTRASELVVEVWRGPNWWLVPAAALLLPAAAIWIYLKAAPAVAPFFYTVN